MTNYVTSQAQTIYGASTIRHPKSGLDSGGSYFEWSDEYWKAYATPTAHQLCKHSGGLNAIAKPAPSATPQVPMSPRPDFFALETQFAAEK